MRRAAGCELKPARGRAFWVLLVGGLVPIGNTGYSVARVSLTNEGNGNHTATGTAPFGVSVYGYGQYTSYWYPAGADLIQLHQ